MVEPESIGGGINSQPVNDWLSYLDSKKVGKDWMPYVNVSDYGAIGDYDPISGTGTDDSDAIQAAVDALPGGGRMQFPSGVFYFSNVTASPGTVLYIDGETSGRTSFYGTTTMLKVGDDSTNTDLFVMENIEILSSGDVPYDKPLIDLHFVRNYFVRSVGSDMEGTGTLFLLSDSYNGMFQQCGNLRTGRYGVPFEITTNRASEQIDTIKFEQVINAGNFGPIIRDSGGNVHNVRADGLKVVAIDDAGRDFESTLISASSIGETSISVVDASGFVSEDAVFIDFGDVVEVNRITSISGDILTLAQPLTKSHLSGTQVVAGGFCISFASVFSPLIYASHFEGHPVGILAGSVRGLETQGNYSGVAEFCRICSSSQDVKIGMTTMGGQVGGTRNEVIHVPNWNAENIDRIYAHGFFPVPSGSPDLVIYGGISPSVVYGKTENNAGILERVENVPYESQSKNQIKNLIEGVEKFRRTYDGQHVWNNNVVMKSESTSRIGVSHNFAARIFYFKDAYNGTNIAEALAGSGSPNGVISAPRGSIYLRIDGAAGQCLYVKEDTSANTGWAPK